MKLLRDCPFCGSTNPRIEFNPYELPDFVYNVHCTICHSKAAASGSLVGAVENWNKKADKYKARENALVEVLKLLMKEGESNV